MSSSETLLVEPGAKSASNWATRFFTAPLMDRRYTDSHYQKCYPKNGLAMSYIEFVLDPWTNTNCYDLRWENTN